jgi:hypothetical protein
VTNPPFNIAAAFKNKETAMRAAFLAIRDVTAHSTTRGDQSQADWVGLIRDFLPTRYAVGPIFAVDCHGNMSQQIDAAVYDTHFSPQSFGGAGGVRFVPVESVYAVFEVKPQFDSEYLDYARKKVASVRSLQRTSYAVVHKGGTYERTEIQMRPIIGGILTTRAGLKDPIAKLEATQPAYEANEFLNIGICLDECAFDYTPTIDDESVTIDRTICADGNQLIHFAIRLFRQLQAIGSVPPVDMTMYEKNILAPDPEAADRQD